jgi:predicted transcriptional regulator
MAGKRTKLEVIKDLLDVLKNNRKVKITHLIYKANLSNNSIKPYLEDLLKKGLIETCKENDKKFFVISKKGSDFLDEFNKMKILSEAYGL